MSPSDLRRLAPLVFDSVPAKGPKGHSCHCIRDHSYDAQQKRVMALNLVIAAIV